MSKTFVFTPFSTYMMGKQGRQRVFKILIKTLSIPIIELRGRIYKKTKKKKKKMKKKKRKMMMMMMMMMKVVKNQEGEKAKK